MEFDVSLRTVGISLAMPEACPAVDTFLAVKGRHTIFVAWEHRQELPRRQSTQLFGAGGFGNFNVHEKPNTNVRPFGRALAEYSS